MGWEAVGRLGGGQVEGRYAFLVLPGPAWAVRSSQVEVGCRVGFRFRFRLGQVGTVHGRSWHVWLDGEGMEASPLSNLATDGRVPRRRGQRGKESGTLAARVLVCTVL